MFPPVICRSADFCFERDWLLSIIFPVGDTLDVAGSIDLTTANWKSMYDVFWKMHVVVWAPPPFLLCPYKALSKPYANMWHICIFTAVLFNSCSLRDEAVFATKQQQFGEHRRIQNAECGTTAPSLYFRSVWYFLKKPEEPQVRLPAFKVHIWLGCDSFGKMATKVDRNHSRRNFVEYPPNDIFFYCSSTHVDFPHPLPKALIWTTVPAKGGSIIRGTMYQYGQRNVRRMQSLCNVYKRSESCTHVQ